MSSKKNRQTMEKLRREQAVKKRREDKLQRKADAKAAKAAGALEPAPSELADEAVDGAVGPPGQVSPDTVEPTQNGSGLREAPSLRVHE
jgi:hypothetical protein